MKTKHISTNLFRLLLCLALLSGAGPLLSAAHGADAFTGNFTGREVKLQLKPDGSKWKGKLLLKNQPYTIQGENQRGTLTGTYSNGDRDWQFTFKIEGADMTFIAGTFTATLARSADSHDCIYCKGSKHCTACEGTGRTQCVSCSGTGTYNDGKSCISCKGRGKTDCSVCNGGGRCRKCFGSGVENDGCIYCKGSGNCQNCIGTGKMPCVVCYNGVSSSDRKTPCGICRGTGKVDCSVCNDSGRCRKCHGTGKKQD